MAVMPLHGDNVLHGAIGKIKEIAHQHGVGAVLVAGLGFAEDVRAQMWNSAWVWRSGWYSSVCSNSRPAP